MPKRIKNNVGKTFPAQLNPDLGRQSCKKRALIFHTNPDPDQTAGWVNLSERREQKEKTTNNQRD